MEMNYGIILLVTIIAFVGGAVWYGPLFGKIWMRIHHGDTKFSDSEMKEKMKGMWKLLLSEFITTFILMTTLAFFIKEMDGYRAIAVAFFVWIGFALPMIISDVIWGGDRKEWMCTKISIMLGFRFIALIFAGFMYGMWL